MSGLAWRLLALAGTAGAVFLVAWVLLDVLFGRTVVQRRLAGLARFRIGPRPDRDPMLRVLRAAGGRLVDRSELLARYALRSEPLLDRAVGGLPPSEWLAVRLVAGLAGVLVASSLLTWLLAVPLGFLFGFALTNLGLRTRISRRERAFNDELPGTLQLVLSSLRSGFTLQQSVEAAVRDDDGPVAEEFRRALSETRINGEFEDALERIGVRVNSSEMTWLVMAIRLQREVGGSLADVMQTTADTLRERAYLRRHVRALSAEGRISAGVLVALPIGTAVMLYVMRPEYLMPLFTEPLGLLMLGAAVLLMAIGGVWLRACVQVKV
jgi:tight adherence protein B